MTGADTSRHPVRSPTPAPADATVEALAGWTIGETLDLRRRHVRRASRRNAQYEAQYDDRTLFYDCVYLPDQARYVFTAPRFLNLWRPFRDGLRLDGHRVRGLRRRTWLRCEQVALAAAPGRLTFEYRGERFPLPQRMGDGARFAGLNCGLAVNKDNPLRWIRDWARFLADAHGMEGVVIIDNGSTRYTPEELCETLSAVPGLRAVQIVSAPFPYGPAERAGRFELSARFFQTAMLNVARRDMLRNARAVLSVDIDEIVQAHGPSSVFDLAAAHPLGLVRLRGNWIYPAPGTEGAAPHGAHRYRRQPDRACNPKWCVAAGSIMGRFGWSVHDIGGPLSSWFTGTSAVSLLHCRATSTGWKGKRFQLPSRLAPDPELAALMDRSFPDD